MRDVQERLMQISMAIWETGPFSIDPSRKEADTHILLFQVMVKEIPGNSRSNKHGALHIPETF